MVKFRAFGLLVLLAAGPARADFCMLTQNGLHLGQGKPAYQQVKRAVLQGIFDDYDVIALQEVMNAEEAARLAPPGFIASVSAAKGATSYREHYAMLTRQAAMRVLATADYPDPGGLFARPPFAIAVEDRSGARFWLAATHVVFGKSGLAPRRREVAAMAEAMAHFAAQPLPDGSTIGRVVVAGDWNLPAADKAFATLPDIFKVAPEVPSTLNAKGIFASSYDHYLWQHQRLAVDFAADPRDSGGLSPGVYRNTVSDHVGVAGYVMADPQASRPEGTVCPPRRTGEISAARP